MRPTPNNALRPTRRGFTGLLATAPFVRLRPLRELEAPRVACVGVWNRGNANVGGVVGAGAEVAALVDVDRGHLERAAGALEKKGQKGARLLADWRAIVDDPKGLDGVVVSTPDHLHAPVAAAALRQGLAVYCEKPLSHTVEEARHLQRLAREKKVATQMGIQIHSTDNYRRVVELVRAGVIGDVEEVHVLCSKSWSNGRYGEEKPVPANLDWDLWLGPAAVRPYTDGLHPAWWRKFWDFGTGTVGDMACHWVDLVHWALDLDAPASTTAEGPELHADGTPEWLHAVWHHAAKGERPAVDVHWWDGGKRPDVAPEGWRDCHVWVGTKGRIHSTYGNHEVVMDDPSAEWTRPEKSIAKSKGHHKEWVDEIRGEGKGLCPFEYSAGLTEAVLMATVAFRAGGSAENADAALLTKEYRDGFGLG